MIIADNLCILPEEFPQTEDLARRLKKAKEAVEICISKLSLAFPNQELPVAKVEKDKNDSSRLPTQCLPSKEDINPPLSDKDERTIANYESKFAELRTKDTEEKNACLAIMLEFYPTATNTIEHFINNGAKIHEAEKLIQDANSDNVTFDSYRKYFRACLQIKFDIKNNKPNRTYDDNNASVLMVAAHHLLVEEVITLINIGADVLAENKFGDKVLNIDSNEVIYTIITNKMISLNAVDVPINSDGVTALMMAVNCGSEKLVKRLLEANANIFAQDNDGKSALLRDNKNRSVHKLLLQKIIDTGQANTPVDKNGKTALFWAATLGLDEEMNKLLPPVTNREMVNKWLDDFNPNNTQSEKQPTKSRASRRKF